MGRAFLDASTRSYWRFYWPLSLMGAVAMSGRLLQNYVLLDYEAGVREMAVFALAMAVAQPFQMVLAFVPQMANVLVRGPRSLGSSIRFVVTVGLVFTLPVVVLGWTPVGRIVLPVIYRVGPERIGRIMLYLRYLTPVTLMVGLAFFCEGLLVQGRRTMAVGGLRVLNVLVLAGVLVVGRRLGWSPTLTLSLSMIVPRFLHMVLAGALTLACYRYPPSGEDRRLSQREIAGFFGPMAATTIMFTLSRPIVFGFLTAVYAGGGPGASGADSAVAAVNLAFSLSMLFQGSVNQFRNLFVTFGKGDPAGVRRFMIRVTAAITVLMLVVIVTPLASFFLGRLQGASGDTLRMARQGLWVLLLVPVVIGWRNYYHGLAMVQRRTLAMAAGSVCRNVAILAAAGALVALGGYNHVAATAMLVFGFTAEATTVFLLTKYWRHGPRPAEA